MNYKIDVKSWYHEKKMNEQKRNVQSTHVVAVSKETEKAMFVTVASGSQYMSYWAPKSCLIIKESGEEFNPTEDAMLCSDLQQAVSQAKYYMSFWA